ncbi:MAG: peptide deformylase [Nitrospiraceae bacterium]|nr:peptide deformylase [Nitrospiraceae bacterium]
MALLDIKKYPENVLKAKTLPVTDINVDIQHLVNDMLETMYDAGGIGLAANQVGILKRLCVIDLRAANEQTPLIVLINPEIIEKTGIAEAEEGCLSVPDYRAKVRRAEQIFVKGMDITGRLVEIEAKDLLARVLQHEIDHLDGFLFIDRLTPIKKDFFKKQHKKKSVKNR